jgi:tetratricopeptide (TPR) repeat protein
MSMIGIALALILGGCNRFWSPSEQNAQNRTAGDQQTQQAVETGAGGQLPPLPAVSAHGADTYGDRLGNAFKSDQAAALRLIDFDAIIDVALRDIAAGPDNKAFQDLKEKTRRDLKSSLTRPDGLIALISDGVKNGGSLTYLGSFERAPHKDQAKRRFVLFRFVSPSGGGVNYFRLALSQTAGVTADDFYAYSTLEPLSETFRRAFLAELHQSGLKPSFTGQTAEQVKSLFECLVRIQQMEDLLAKGFWQDAWDMFDALAAPVREMRYPQALRIQAATNIDKDHFRTAVDAFSKAIPDDPGIKLVAAAGFLQLNDTTEAEKAVDRLSELLSHVRRASEQLDGVKTAEAHGSEREKAILPETQAVAGSDKSDPYLISLRASLALQLGDQQQAAELAGKAIKADPALIDPYWTWIGAALKQKSDPTATHVLSDLSRKLLVDPKDLPTIPVFRDFTHKLADAERARLNNWLAKIKGQTTLVPK